jgi:hypothetical protein
MRLTAVNAGSDGCQRCSPCHRITLHVRAGTGCDP